MKLETIKKWAPVVIIAALLLRVVYLQHNVTQLSKQTATLEENLASKTIIEKDKIIYIDRDVEGKAQKEIIYIPAAGKVEILKPKEDVSLKQSTWEKLTTKTIDTNDSTIVVKYRGFTFHPELAVFYSKEVEVGVQAQLAFWGRYSAGIGIGHETTAYAFGQRAISDIAPFAKNTNLMVNFGRNLKDQDFRVGVGLSIGF